MTIERVAIIGRGAVGLLYASMIEQNIGSGVVEFVMDDERYERRKDQQITINGKPCLIPTIPASKATPVDLVILTIKAPGLAVALDTMEHLVDSNTYIASLINGVRSEQRIAERFGWQHTVLSVAQGMDAVFIENALSFTHTGEIRFGAAEGTAPGVVEAIDDFYSRAKITHVVEADIKRRLWVKFMLNCGVNQVSMAYAGTYGSAVEEGTEQCRCFVAAMREALAVARAEGVDVTEADLSEMFELISTLDPQGIPSMGQDRINRKHTEVEEFAGTLISLAERHGILVPTNRFLYDQIRAIESEFDTAN